MIGTKKKRVKAGRDIIPPCERKGRLMLIDMAGSQP
jgi:hypothetical protein